MTGAISGGLDNSLGRARSAITGRGGRGTPNAPTAPNGTFPARHGAFHAPAGDVPILTLNDRWRLAHDRRLQWVLQQRESRPGARSTVWRGRRFHVERDALLRSVRELCGPVDPAALETIRRWPPMYGPDFASAPAWAAR